MVKRIAESASQNKTPIREALSPYFLNLKLVLEIASGTGQHIIEFAQHFPHTVWQPSDLTPEAIESIKAWREEVELSNIKAPLQIDASEESWPVESVDAILCINMIHISSWDACVGLFRNASQVVKPGGFVFLYGPFFEDDKETAPSNIYFDEALRSRNSAWGVRRLAEVRAVAKEWGFELGKRIEMPVNNLTLVFKRS